MPSERENQAWRALHRSRLRVPVMEAADRVDTLMVALRRLAGGDAGQLPHARTQVRALRDLCDAIETALTQPAGVETDDDETD